MVKRACRTPRAQKIRGVAGIEYHELVLIDRAAGTLTLLVAAED